MKKILLRALAIIFFIAALKEAPIIAVLMLVVGFFYYKKKIASNNSEKVIAQNQSISIERKPLAATTLNTLTDYPEIDHKGMNQLKLLDGVRLSGVTKKHDGTNPQEIIANMNIGDDVFFKRIKMSKYPNAILVVNDEDEPLGWIPEDFLYQEDIAKRLDDGTTVLGKVNDIYGGYEGKSYGIKIDIMRYEKKRVKKTENIHSDVTNE